MNNNFLTRRNKYYQGPESDHFNGRKFFNPWNPQPPKTFMDMVKWRMSRGNIKWPEKVERTRSAIPPVRVEGKNLHVTNIGHATILLQTAGLNIITDPVFSDRASPFSFIGPKRVSAPGIDFDNLPKIDVILLSHNHYDHMDLSSLKKLWERDKPLILTPLGNDTIINFIHSDIKVEVLDWGFSKEFAGVNFTLEPAQHWSARWINDRNDALWGSFVIECSYGKIYFAADSGYGEHFKKIGEKYGKFDFSLIPIGAYEPRWFMKYLHMNPKDAVRAFYDLNTEKAMAIHFEVFKLTNEGHGSPRRHIAAAIERSRIKEQDFIIPYIGEEFEF